MTALAGLDTPSRRYSLSDLYDADRRTVDPQAHSLAERLIIPHPLTNVGYADGLLACTHARHHSGPGCTDQPFTTRASTP